MHAFSKFIANSVSKRILKNGYELAEIMP